MGYVLSTFEAALYKSAHYITLHYILDAPDSPADFDNQSINQSIFILGTEPIEQ